MFTSLQGSVVVTVLAVMALVATWEPRHLRPRDAHRQPVDATPAETRRELVGGRS